jgi:hypothetical protein
MAYSPGTIEPWAILLTWIILANYLKISYFFIPYKTHVKSFSPIVILSDPWGPWL